MRNSVLRAVVQRAGAITTFSKPELCLALHSAAVLGLTPVAAAPGGATNETLFRALREAFPYCDGGELGMLMRSIALPAAARHLPNRVLVDSAVAVAQLPAAEQQDAALWLLRAAAGSVASLLPSFNAVERAVASADMKKTGLAALLAAVEGLSWRESTHRAVTESGSGTAEWPAPVALLSRRFSRVKDAEVAMRAAVALRWCDVTVLGSRGAVEDHAALPSGAALLLFGGSTGGPAFLEHVERALSSQTASVVEVVFTLECIVALLQKRSMLSEEAIATVTRHATVGLQLALRHAQTYSEQGVSTNDLIRSAVRVVAQLGAAAEEALSSFEPLIQDAPICTASDMPAAAIDDAASPNVRALLRPTALVAQHAASSEIDALPRLRILNALRDVRSAATDASTVPALWASLRMLHEDGLSDPRSVEAAARKTAAVALDDEATMQTIKQLAVPARWFTDPEAARRVVGSVGSSSAEGDKAASSSGIALTCNGPSILHKLLHETGSATREELTEVAAFVRSLVAGADSAASASLQSIAGWDNATAALLVLALTRYAVADAVKAADAIAASPAVASPSPAAAMRLVCACQLLPLAMHGGRGKEATRAVAIKWLEKALTADPSGVQAALDAMVPEATPDRAVAACTKALAAASVRMSHWEAVGCSGRLLRVAAIIGPAAASPLQLEASPSLAPLSDDDMLQRGAPSLLRDLHQRTSASAVKDLAVTLPGATAEEVALLLEGLAAGAKAPTEATITLVQRAVIELCNARKQPTDTLLRILACLRALYVPHGDALVRLEAAIATQLETVTQVGAALSCVRPDSTKAFTAALEAFCEEWMTGSPAEVEAVCRGAVACSTHSATLWKALQGVSERALERLSESVKSGERLRASAATAAMAAAVTFGTALSCKRDAAASLLEWLSGDGAPLLGPDDLVITAQFMASSGIVDADYAHALGAQLVRLGTLATPRHVADTVFHLSRAGGFNTVHLQRLADTVVDRAAEFRRAKDIIRLLHGFTKMGVMHRGTYNTMAARLRLRPVLHSASVAEAAVALDAFAGAKYLDEGVFRALSGRIDRHIAQCGVIEIALAAQSHADLYVLNAPFYNRLADRAVELAGPEPTPAVLPGTAEGEEAAAATEGNASAGVLSSGTQALSKFPLAAGVKFLEALGAAGIQRTDAANAVIRRVLRENAAEITAPEALRLMGALCDMEYSGEALDALSNALVDRMEGLTSVDLKELCCMLLMLNWRDDNLLRAVGDHAVRLEADGALEPLTARLALDTLNHFLHFHRLARAQLSDSARSVSRVLLPDDQPPKGLEGASSEAKLAA
jgi:hypothetical protein